MPRHGLRGSHSSAFDYQGPTSHDLRFCIGSLLHFQPFAGFAFFA